jgi:hypothetical protein
MKKQTLTMLTVVSFLANAGAQEAQVVQAQSSSAQVPVATVTPAQGANSNQVIVISESQAKQEQKAIAQPTTVVEAAPLSLSKADEMRTARQRAEIETEQKIVEKLEASRLQDEQTRAERVLGAGAQVKAQEVKTEVQQAAPALPQIIVVTPSQLAPVQAAPAAQSTVQAAPVQQAQASEAIAPIQETAKVDIKDLVKADALIRRYSMGINVGNVSYDAFNVSDEVGAGLDFGWHFDRNISAEFGFMFSRHYIEDTFFSFQQMDQYNFTAGIRYAFLNHKISPVVGALGSYTWRDYTRPYTMNVRNSNSDAFDVGLLLGLQIEATRKVALAIDYRMMMNLTTNYSNPALNRPLFGAALPVEELNYDILSFNIRFYF